MALCAERNLIKASAAAHGRKSDNVQMAIQWHPSGDPGILSNAKANCYKFPFTGTEESVADERTDEHVQHDGNGNARAKNFRLFLSPPQVGRKFDASNVSVQARKGLGMLRSHRISLSCLNTPV